MVVNGLGPPTPGPRLSPFLYGEGSGEEHYTRAQRLTGCHEKGLSERGQERQAGTGFSAELSWGRGWESVCLAFTVCMLITYCMGGLNCLVSSLCVYIFVCAV